MSNVRCQSGMALLATVLIILLIMIAVGLSMVSTGMINGFTSDAHRESEAAYFAAQAGTKDALMRLARNKSFTSSGYFLPNGCTLNNPSVCVKIMVENTQSACSQTIGANQNCVIATGTLNNKTRKIETILNVNAINGKITTVSQKEI